MFALATGLLIGVPTARPATPEHEVGINAFMVGATRSTAARAIRTAEVKPLTFAFGVELLSEHAHSRDTAESLRVTLPQGLSFGPRPADPRTLFPSGVPAPWTFVPTSQSCSMAARVADCTAVVNLGGTELFGCLFDVVAERPGAYELRAEITSSGANDPPRQLNASATLRVIVGARSGAVVVGPPELSRPRPSFVQADVRITQGGVPARPKSVTCAGLFRGDKRYSGRAYPGAFALGAARCAWGFNNARYLGKTFLGRITVSVGATKVTRSFSVRMGADQALLSPVGATLAS